MPGLGSQPTGDIVMYLAAGCNSIVIANNFCQVTLRLPSSQTASPLSGHLYNNKQTKERPDLRVIDGHQHRIVSLVGVHQRAAIHRHYHLVGLRQTLRHSGSLIQPVNIQPQ